MSGLFPNSGVPANQALNSVNVTTTNCGGDGGELFHSTNRCTPRFDPAAANAAMSEILNASTSGGLPYDCNRLDNLDRGIKETINDKLFGCLDRDFPASGDACSVEYLVLTEGVDGCKRISRYVESSANRQTLGLYNVWDHKPVNTGGFVIPDDFVDPALFYSAADYSADGGVDTDPYDGGAFGNARRAAPGLDEARLSNAVIGRWTGVNTCRRTYDVRIQVSVQPEATAQDAYTKRSNFVNRIRYRVNGVFTPWLYPFQAGNGLLLSSNPINSILPEVFVDTSITIFPGEFEHEVVYFGNGGGNHVSLRSNTNTPSFGVVLPRAVVTQRIG